MALKTASRADAREGACVGRPSSFEKVNVPTKPFYKPQLLRHLTATIRPVDEIYYPHLIEKLAGKVARNGNYLPSRLVRCRAMGANPFFRSGGGQFSNAQDWNAFVRVTCALKLQS